MKCSRRISCVSLCRCDDFRRSFEDLFLNLFTNQKKDLKSFNIRILFFFFWQPKQSSIHSSINHLFGIFLVLFDSNKQTNIRQINSGMFFSLWNVYFKTSSKQTIKLCKTHFLGGKNGS